MLKALIAALYRLALRIRYRITIEGLEKLKGQSRLLVLPNHPAEIDPVIIVAYFWPYVQLRPVVLERFFHAPGIHAVMRFIGAIPMPDLESDTGFFKRRRVAQGLQAAAKAIQDGGSVLLYPSGKLMRSGFERLGANSGTSMLLKEAPEATPVLVRTRGLLGSSFSCVFNPKRSPEFVPTVLQGIWVALRNLVLLVPKRDLLITVEIAGSDLPRDNEPAELNRYLERWYNSDGPEPPTLVSRSFWKHDVPALPEKAGIDRDFSGVPDEVRTKVHAKLSELSGHPASAMSPDKRLSDDLGFDSLQAAELLLWLDDEFHVTDVQVQDIGSVGDLLLAAAGQLSVRESDIVDETPLEWIPPTDAPPPTLPAGSLIEEIYIAAAFARRSQPAVADERSGVLTHETLLLRTLAVARFLRKLPDTHIGILLPASTAAAIGMLACRLAGKAPVMLNWTAGKKALEHALGSCSINHILTSSAFLDRIEGDLSFIENKFLALEELRKQIGFFDRAIAALLVKSGPGAVAKHFSFNQRKPSDTAAVLFTSGSEAEPKGVPLTHDNIRSNIQGVVEIFALERTDVLLGFLPPFHSFGLTVCTFFPILSGFRVAYYPNPNDARKIALSTAKWLATIVPGTPTFLKNVLKAGTKAHVASVRLFVSGAERAPEDLFKIATEKAPASSVLEGYGITECSPVISVNRPHQLRKGVGRPLSRIEVCIVHPDTLEPLGPTDRGLILVSGPNVFGGYIAGKPDPFVTLGGKRWYNTGDLGYLDEGSIVLAGRKKRFVKIGGEMISLPAIEESLLKRFSQDDADLAVIAKEFEAGRPELVLFSARELSLDEVNEYLRTAGFPNLARIGRFMKLEALPLLGSGKIDHRSLQAMV